MLNVQITLRSRPNPSAPAIEAHKELAGEDKSGLADAIAIGIDFWLSGPSGISSFFFIVFRLKYPKYMVNVPSHWAPSLRNRNDVCHGYIDPDMELRFTTPHGKRK